MPVDPVKGRCDTTDTGSISNATGIGIHGLKKERKYVTILCERIETESVTCQ
jgi:hypothetical protein